MSRNLVVAIVLLVAPSLSAQSNPWPPLVKPPAATGGGASDAAVICGLEDYAYLPDVAGASANARDWYLYLAKTKKIRPDRIRRLSGGECSRETLLKAVRRAAQSVRAGGTLWFVFIGHGAPARDGSEGVLIGADARQTEESLYARSVTQSELLGAATGRQAMTVVVADACFSGRGAKGALVPGLQPVLLAGGKPPGENVLWLSAAKGNEFAGPLPGLARPAFSYLVLGGLRGWADGTFAGKKDGRVTAAETVAYAKGVLEALLNERRQTPTLLGQHENRVLAAGAREDGPDVADLAVALSGETVAVKPVTGGDGAVPAAPKVDLSGLDVEKLKQLERLSKAVQHANATEKSKTATLEARAEAWAAVAMVEVAGGNEWAGRAEKRAARWRALLAQRSRLRADWARVSEMLPLSVVSRKEKLRVVKTVVDGYAALSAEPEHAAARNALARLRRGDDMVPEAPVGTAAGPTGYVAIQPGTFTMGSPPSEAGRDTDERQHRVRITRGFWLKATEVTQREWTAVMGSNPSQHSSCGNCPVEMVSWFDAVKYCNALSRKEGLPECYSADGSRFEGLSCRGYRLPTEAEWEYAARAGATGARYGDLDAIAWYNGNANSTQPVGRKQPNAWGLYDVQGNVWEWTNNWYGSYSGDVTDPTGPSKAKVRLNRGRSFTCDAHEVRFAYRSGNRPDRRYNSLGFRPARSLP